MTPLRAAPEVFTLPELLEMILTKSEMRDILLWQRVDKTFQSTITRSQALQEKLFLRSVEDAGQAPVRNYLVWDHIMRTLNKHLDPSGDDTSHCVLRRTPVAEGYHEIFPDQTLDTHIELSLKIGYDSPPLDVDTALGMGSWRRMLLTQPPVDMGFEAVGKKIRRRGI
ncbi:hypothetical protein B0A48_00869 [Cryoendolithus antarcticus]|uniref:F-box domain-containing protein n=1 Tax=Cryoendolithus antarcticus TaxID=1507870 RepID=A0A1V8TRR8_9PEZI|nr:hypothetical protein B0A48_00869 [Cryoendolithus antarcticus]